MPPSRKTSQQAAPPKPEELIQQMEDSFKAFQVFIFVSFLTPRPFIQEEVKTKLEEHEKLQTTVEEGIQELKSKGEARYYLKEVENL